MAAERPQARDDEAAIEILRGEAVRDAFVLLVRVLGALEPPLLLVGDDLDADEEDQQPREDEVRHAEGGGAFVRKLGQHDEEVGRRGDEAQQQRLRQRNEEHVEDEEARPAVDVRPHNRPPVVL